MTNNGNALSKIALGITIGVVIAVLYMALIAPSLLTRTVEVPVTVTPARSIIAPVEVTATELPAALPTLLPPEPTAVAIATAIPTATEAPVPIILPTATTAPVIVQPEKDTFWPDDAQVNGLPWIWDIAANKYGAQTIPTRPDTYRFPIDVRAYTEYKWGMIWCSENNYPLADVLAPLNGMTFLVNGQPVDAGDLRSYDGPGKRGQETCRFWYTGIHGAVPGETLTLELRYNVSRDLYDGAGTTIGGDYRLIIEATAH